MAAKEGYALPDQLDERFSRTAKLLGESAAARLRQACAVVVGLGAVGSYAAEALARAGVGALRLVDMDVVRPSNFNRQLLATEDALGRLKVEVGRERALSINPACRVEALPVFAHVETFGQILAGAPAVVIDAIDSLTPKRELIAAAMAAKIPVVSAMGAALRRDASALRVADLAETRRCPLARLLRKQLRQRGISQGVRCVYSEELNPPLLEVSEEEARAGGEGDDFKRGRPRRALGSLPTITGMAGLLAAHEALKLICDEEWN